MKRSDGTYEYCDEHNRYLDGYAAGRIDGQAQRPYDVHRPTELELDDWISGYADGYRGQPQAQMRGLNA